MRALLILPFLQFINNNGLLHHFCSHNICCYLGFHHKVIANQVLKEWCNNYRAKIEETQTSLRNCTTISQQVRRRTCENCWNLCLPDSRDKVACQPHFMLAWRARYPLWQGDCFNWPHHTQTRYINKLERYGMPQVGTKGAGERLDRCRGYNYKFRKSCGQAVENYPEPGNQT